MKADSTQLLETAGIVFSEYSQFRLVKNVDNNFESIPENEVQTKSVFWGQWVFIISYFVDMVDSTKACFYPNIFYSSLILFYSIDLLSYQVSIVKGLYAKNRQKPWGSVSNLLTEYQKQQENIALQELNFF